MKIDLRKKYKIDGKVYSGVELFTLVDDIVCDDNTDIIEFLENKIIVKGDYKVTLSVEEIKEKRKWEKEQFLKQ